MEGTAREAMVSLLLEDIDGVLKRSEDILTQIKEVESGIPMAIDAAFERVTLVLRNETGLLLQAQSESKILATKILESVGAKIESEFEAAKNCAVMQMDGEVTQFLKTINEHWEHCYDSINRTRESVLSDIEAQHILIGKNKEKAVKDIEAAQVVLAFNPTKIFLTTLASIVLSVTVSVAAFAGYFAYTPEDVSAIRVGARVIKNWNQLAPQDQAKLTAIINR